MTLWPCARAVATKSNMGRTKRAASASLFTCRWKRLMSKRWYFLTVRPSRPEKLML